MTTYTYYDITVNPAIQHGTDILNKPCTIVFNYPEGSHSHSYTATVFAWSTANSIRVRSLELNIEGAWRGANGGTVSINTGARNPLNLSITGFTIVK